MTASALFSDFTVPEIIYAADDTSSVETTLDGYSDSDGSITSEYIVANLDEDLGEEAAALNEDAAYMIAEEYLVSELTADSEGADTETSDDSDENAVDVDMETTDTETVTETDEVLTESIGTSSNDADEVSTSSNDVGIATLSLDDETETASVEAEETTDTEETTEVTVSEEEVAEVAEVIIDTSNDITAADDYDTNGLAPTYHYIVLNYSLVDEDLIWDGITIDDLWNEVPDAFIASYLTYVNVYTLEDNEDYYVAFIDPAALNGLGSAIYADFTDLNTESPTIYNDIITFDTETGLVYIPKSFYYNEDGEETLKGLEAQVLVPYSFDSEESSVSVSVASDIDGVEGISGTVSVPTLDVTMTLQIVDAEDADKISLDDISVTVNDDMFPIDLSGDNAYYDTETGELTIASSPNNVYSVNVTIAENVAEETLAMADQREILVASTGDLSNILVAEGDASFWGEAGKAISASAMKTVPGVTVELESGTIVKGQTMTYTATWALKNSHAEISTDVISAVITNTAVYSYYGQYTDSSDTSTYGTVFEIDESNASTVFDSSGNITLPSNQSLLSAVGTASNQMSSTYNRIVSLPDGDELTSTTVSGSYSKTKWTSDITWATSDTSLRSGYENFIAIHCVENGGSTVAESYSGTASVKIIVLYADVDSSGDGYMIVAINIPRAWGQSGSGVYKISVEGTDTTEYTAKFGVNKVDADDDDEWLGAVFSYITSSTLDTSQILSAKSRINGYATQYEEGEITEIDLRNACSEYGLSLYTSSESGITLKSLDSSNCSALANYSGTGYIYVYIGEIIPPDGYERKDGIWVLTIQPGRTENGVKVSDSRLISAKYYTTSTYTSSLPTADATETLYGDGYTFITDNELTDYYGALNLSKVEYGNASTYVSGAVYMLFDYAGYSSAYIEDLIDAAATANATGNADDAIVSFYNSLGSYKDSVVEGVYVTTGTSSQSATLQSFNTSTGARTGSTVIEFGSSSTKAVCLIEIYSPDDYILDDNLYCFVLNANQNKSDTYSTAVTKTTLTSDLSGMNSAFTSLSDGNVTYSGNSKTATLIFKMSDMPYTSHTVSKVRSGTVTNELVKGVVVQLYRSTDGGTTYSATSATQMLNDSNDWTYTFEKLPKYNSSGVEYKYKAVEVFVLMSNQFDTGSTVSSVSADYLETVFTVTSTTADGQTTITNEIDTIDVPVKKDFYDTTASERIKSVVFELYRNNVATGETITLSTGNWSGEFEDLVEYDTTGTAYSYTVKETSVTYEDMWGVEHAVTSESVIETLFNPTVTTASDGTITVMNYFFTTTRYAVKVFGNDETSRLVRITTVLYADGKSMESLDMTTTLSDGNNWTSVNSKWTGLDFYDYTGSQITYTISETNLNKVFNVSTTTSDGQTTITNTIPPTYLNVEKKFDTYTEGRVTAVVVELYRNDEATGEKLTLSDSNNWASSFTDLVKYDENGDAYSYRAVEVSVTYTDMWGKSHTVDDREIIKTIFDVTETTSGNKTTVTNKLNTTTHTVVKTMGSDTTEEVVYSVTARLYADGVSAYSVFGDRVLSESNNWTDTWDGYNASGVWVGLDKYDYQGNEIKYTCKGL